MVIASNALLFLVWLCMAQLLLPCHVSTLCLPRPRINKLFWRLKIRFFLHYLLASNKDSQLQSQDHLTEILKNNPYLHTCFNLFVNSTLELINIAFRWRPNNSSSLKFWGRMSLWKFQTRKSATESCQASAIDKHYNCLTVSNSLFGHERTAQPVYCHCGGQVLCFVQGCSTINALRATIFAAWNTIKMAKLAMKRRWELSSYLYDVD